MHNLLAAQPFCSFEFNPLLINHWSLSVSDNGSTTSTTDSNHYVRGPPRILISVSDFLNEKNIYMRKKNKKNQNNLFLTERLVSCSSIFFRCNLCVNEFLQVIYTDTILVTSCLSPS